MNAKDIYRDLCDKEISIPLFLKDWWLDCVAGHESWDVALVLENDQPVACMPYVIKKILWNNVILMPPLSPSMGVWVRYPPGQKYNSKLAFEKKIYTRLIDELPRFARFHQRFHYSFTNWLPFFWRGFRQTTRYTYVIEDLSDLDQVFANFRENIRREIRKAQKQLAVREDDKVTRFYDACKASFERQGIRMRQPMSFFERLHRACKEHGCGKIMIAEDDKGRVHSALFLVWDEMAADYLLGGSDPDLRSSGAASLLMWQAIQFAAEVSKSFDFGGSMMEPIENYFRAFGGTQKPYFSISKNNLIFDVMAFFRERGSR